jgi:glycosyltransferase involved in cell wall biosynthesis
LVFTVSEYSRREIASRYRVPLDDIGVLSNAWDRSRFFPGGHDSELVSRYGLHPGQYLLTVGRIEPRKNHAKLLRAYARLDGRPPPLVVIGQRDFGYGEFERALRDLPPDRSVRILDDISDAALPAFYRNAMFFVYPSLAEGFGMPPLEAMASGIPVMASTATAIPEVLGSAGLLVDPLDIEAITNGLRRLCNDANLRAALAEKGLARAQHYSWRKSAMSLKNSYAEYFRLIGCYLDAPF